LRYPFIAAIALLLLASPMSVFAQSGNDPIQTDQSIGVESDGTSDAAIDRRIRDILGEIEGFGDVTIEVHSGVVTAEGEVLDRAAIDQLSRIIQRVDGVVALEMEVTESTDVADRIAPAWERLKTRALNTLALAPLLLVAFLVFAVVSWIGFLVTKSEKFWRRFGPNSFITDIYRVIARLAFIVAGLVLALDILNATALIGAVLGAAGVVGLAVGFAVRDTVENFIASIMLSIRQPFRPFDYVDIEGTEGTVARLTSRATILISADGNHIRVPNATVFKSRIINYTLNPERRFDFRLGVDPSADIGTALKVANEALIALPFALNDPAPLVYTDEVVDSAVILAFQAWIDQRETKFLTARGEAIRATKAALEANGIELPEPTYRLNLPTQIVPDRTAQPAKPATPTEPAHALTEGELMDVSAPKAGEDHLVRQVEEERAKNQQNDLLDEGRKLE
jgi:small conductance mechanosensitive channel